MSEMVVLIQNMDGLKKGLGERAYLDVNECAFGWLKGDIYVYRRWKKTITNMVMDFLTVGGYFRCFHIKRVRSPMSSIRKKYGNLYTSRIGRMRFEELVETIKIIKKYEVDKLPVFDLDHLLELGYKIEVDGEGGSPK